MIGILFVILLIPAFCGVVAGLIWEAIAFGFGAGRGRFHEWTESIRRNQ